MTSTVTAIVSLYKSDRFIDGLIDDLRNQTLHAQGRLSAVFVVSGGSTYEYDAVRLAINDGLNAKLIHTHREPMYASWNKALALATGDYITNANADDRHAPDCLETLATYLDAHQDADFVYAGQHITNVANTTWQDALSAGFSPPVIIGDLYWSDHSPRAMLELCTVGCQPMWRKSLHERCGLFDESFVSAGDYEMWLRLLANGVKLHHLNVYNGLFYLEPGHNISGDRWLSAYESRRAQLRHKHDITHHWHID